MGLLSRILGTERPAPDMARAEPVFVTRAAGATVTADSSLGWSGFGLGGLGSFGLLGSTTGQPVTPYTALAAPAVYAAVRCLSEDLGKLPLVVRRKLPGGGWRPDPAHPLNGLLRRPNNWMSASDFKSFVVASLCLRGNSYTVILRDQAGRPRRLVPVNPDRVGVYLSPAGWLYYSLSHPLVGDGILIHQDDMIHVRGMTLDGYLGVSPVAAGSEAIGLALATQQHGATLFRQGAQVATVLKAPGKLSAEAVQRLAQSWQNAYGGVQAAHRTAVLEEGLTVEKLALTNEQSQFLGTRAHSVIEIARLFRVPPHKIMDYSQAHYANAENASMEYVSDGLMPIAKRIEEACDEDLLFEDERCWLSVRFDFDELLRGDTPSRYGAYAVGVNNGWLSVNEVRAKEGMAPIDGGDEYRKPLNTGAIGDVPPDDPAAVTAPPVPSVPVPPST